MKTSSHLSAIMFTDIVGYTAMMEKDRESAMTAAKNHEQTLIRLVNKYGGEIQNFMGDGSLCLFNSALDAIKCAKEIQLSLKGQVPLRIGIHVGEITIEDGRAYGDGVNVASRIESSGHTGAILFSESVYDKIKNDSSLQATSLGIFNFKNVSKPMEVFALVDDDLPPINKKLLLNQSSKHRRQIRRALYMIGALGLIAGGFFSVNLLLGGTRLPEDVLEERLAIVDFSNQTQDTTLNILGRYLADNLHKAFHKIDNVILVDRTQVNQHSDKLGILPGNIDNEASFYDYTKAKYTIEGQYYSKNENTIELLVEVNDKIEGKTVFQFDKISGNIDEKEDLSNKLQDEILGYWVTKGDVEKFKMDPPKYSAYVDHWKGMHWNFKEPDSAIFYQKKAIELDPDFINAYYQLSTRYWMTRQFSKHDSVEELILRKFGDDPKVRYGYESTKAIREGNFKKEFILNYERFKQNPENGNALWNAAWMANCNNYPKLALEIFHTDIDDEINYEVLPEMWQSRLGNMARAYNKLGEFQKALDLIVTHVPKNSSHDKQAMMRIKAYANLNMPEKIDAFGQVRRGSERLTQFDVNLMAAEQYYLLGNDLMVNKFSDQALHDSDIEFSSINPELLGHIFFLQGNYKKSNAEWTRLLDSIENTIGIEINFDTLSLKIRLAILETYLDKDKTSTVPNIFNKIEDKGDNISLGNHKAFRIIPYGKAIIYAQLGEKEKAMEHLREAYDKAGVYYFYDRYNEDPYLRPLFDYPPFQEFVKPKEYLE